MATHSSILVWKNLEKPMERGARWATVHGVTESDTTERARAHTHTHTHTHSCVEGVGCRRRTWEP